MWGAERHRTTAETTEQNEFVLGEGFVAVAHRTMRQRESPADEAKRKIFACEQRLCWVLSTLLLSVFECGVFQTSPSESSDAKKGNAVRRPLAVFWAVFQAYRALSNPVQEGLSERERCVVKRPFLRPIPVDFPVSSDEK